MAVQLASICQYGDYQVVSTPTPRIGFGWAQRMKGQDEMGYGQKIHSDYSIRFQGRIHKVYITCFSNVSSWWVMSHGQKYHCEDIVQQYVDDRRLK